MTITKLKKSGEYHHDEETSSHRQLASKVLLFFNLKQKQKKTSYIEIDKSEKNGRWGGHGLCYYGGTEYLYKEEDNTSVIEEKENICGKWWGYHMGW